MSKRTKRALRVLIAEDDDEMRRLLVEHFHRAGWEACGAIDGADLVAQMEASASLPQMVPDLIVSDERMPRMRGLEALQVLVDGGVHCPFILITSFGEPELHEAAKRLGARMTFDKPVDLDVLVEVAEAVVAAETR